MDKFNSVRNTLTHPERNCIWCGLTRLTDTKTHRRREAGKASKPQGFGSAQTRFHWSRLPQALSSVQSPRTDLSGILVQSLTTLRAKAFFPYIQSESPVFQLASTTSHAQLRKASSSAGMVSRDNLPSRSITQISSAAGCPRRHLNWT